MRFSFDATVPARRAVLLAAAAVATTTSGPLRAHAEGRTTAQTVGVTTDSLLGIVWGGKSRCDPTDVTCQAGGVEVDGPAIETVPPPRAKPATERFGLDVSVGGQSVGRMVVGLWAESAPGSCDAFSQLARGVLITEEGDEPAKLERSAAVKIQRDRAVELGDLKNRGGSLRLMAGRTKPVRFPVVPPRNDDADNGLSHDRAGLLSVRRGGGAFSFVLTPKANAELDREFIVIGQILDDEGMQVLGRLNQLPVNNYDQAPLASVKIDRVVPL